MKKLAVLVSLALVFIVGCASPEKEMKPFVGRPSSELLNALGSPEIKTTDKNGGEIWTYTQRKAYSTPAVERTYTTYNSTGSGMIASTRTEITPSRSYMSTTLKHFYVGADGVVYNYSWERQ